MAGDLTLKIIPMFPEWSIQCTPCQAEELRRLPGAHDFVSMLDRFPRSIFFSKIFFQFPQHARVEIWSLHDSRLSDGLSWRVFQSWRVHGFLRIACMRAVTLTDTLSPRTFAKDAKDLILFLLGFSARWSSRVLGWNRFPLGHLVQLVVDVLLNGEEQYEYE